MRPHLRLAAVAAVVQAHREEVGDAVTEVAGRAHRRQRVRVAGHRGDHVLVAGLEQLKHEVVAVDATPQLGHEDVPVRRRDVGRVGDDARHRPSAGGVRPVEEVPELHAVPVGDTPGGDVGPRLRDRRLADVVAGHPQPGQASDDVGDRGRVTGAELDDALLAPAQLRAVLLQEQADREAVVRRLVSRGEARHRPPVPRDRKRNASVTQLVRDRDRRISCGRPPRRAARGRAPARCRCRRGRRACGPVRARGPPPRRRGCPWR